MHSVIREIVFYFLFVWVVLLIAYGHRDPYAHFMTQNIENTFVGHQESPGAREDDKHEANIKKSAGDDIVRLTDVSSYEKRLFLQIKEPETCEKIAYDQALLVGYTHATRGATCDFSR